MIRIATVKRVLFENKADHYAVLLLTHGLVAVFRDMPRPAVGKAVELRGNWYRHPKYGKQLWVDSWQLQESKTGNGDVFLDALDRREAQFDDDGIPADLLQAVECDGCTDAEWLLARVANGDKLERLN